MKTMTRLAKDNSTPAVAGNAATAGRQVVLVFQGGGALGAYQAGTYQALHEAGVEPDWIVGTSIGAINACLIAGNAPEKRLEKLTTFWGRVASKSHGGLWPPLAKQLQYLTAVMAGVPNFFAPNPMAFMGQNVKLGPDRAAFYSTQRLQQTLSDLVDFDRIQTNTPRLTVGAAHVGTSKMVYFDSRDMPIDVRHIMASGALPPAFPAVRIDGEQYWDGGILSNTPTEVVFDDNPRRDSLVFSVHLWNPEGPEPTTIPEVIHRAKDIQYSSRVASHITRQQQTHRLRHIIKALAEHIPDEVRTQGAVRELESWGCATQMHVMRLLAPSLANQDHTKDIDFSPQGITARWKAGYQDTVAAIAAAPWQAACDPLDGVILHEGPWGMPPAPVAASAKTADQRRTQTEE